jgi:hypothetical protein
MVSVKELTDINTKKFAIQLNYQKYRSIPVKKINEL